MTVRAAWVSSILNGAGLRELTSAQQLLSSPDSVLSSVMALNPNEPAEEDLYGLMSGTAACLKKRKGFLNTLPMASDSLELCSFLDWAKPLSQARYRPLRVAATIGVLHQVERVLKAISFDTTLSEATKSQLEVCAKVFSLVAIPRSRDTFPVIRQAVAELLCRWAVANPIVLKSSSWGRTGGIFSPLTDLIIDDEPQVRAQAISGISEIIAEYPSVKLPLVLVKLLVRSFLQRCEEYVDSPYSVDELSAITELLRSLITADPGIQDSVSEFESAFQTLWDGRLPVTIRLTLARTVSKGILTTDVFDPEFADASKFVAMVLVFAQQYSPHDTSDGALSHASVFEAFALGLSESVIGESLGVLADTLQTGERERRVHGEFFNALAAAVQTNGFFSVSVEGLRKLERSALDVNVLAGMATLAKAGVPIPGDLLKNIQDVVESESSTYLMRYMAYRVWGYRAALDERWREALAVHGAQLDRHLTTHTLGNIHALESAVERPLADLEAMDKLLDFIAQGEIASISHLACALDVVFIQTLKRTSTVTERELLMRLHAKLKQVLGRLISEVGKDAGSDAQLIAFLSKYRLGCLETPTAMVKTKESIELKLDVRNIPVNTYIISQIIDSESLAQQIVQVME